jgi:hypothetical protein
VGHSKKPYDVMNIFLRDDLWCFSYDLLYRLFSVCIKVGIDSSLFERCLMK